MKKLSTLLAVSLLAGSAVASPYNWNGIGVTSADKAIEHGGKAAGIYTASGKTEINTNSNMQAGASQKGNWCLKINKGFKETDTERYYIGIKLDEAVNAGDTIKAAPFIASENACVFGMDFSADSASQATTYQIYTTGTLQLLSSNGIPADSAFIVPEGVVNAKYIRVYRKSGSTGLYIAHLEVAPKVEAGPKTLTAGEYIIQNVETGFFLSGGNDWGTHASLLNRPAAFNLEVLESGAYKLDSYQSNGGDKHYLGSELYVDADAVPWTITLDENGSATINNEGKYLAGNGKHNTIVTVTDATAASAQWKFISMADIVASQAAATAENPVDVTALLKNSQLQRNGNHFWTLTSFDGAAAPKNYSWGQNGNIANCSESYHSANGFKVQQTLTGLKKGVYGFAAHAFYRQDDGKNETKPYVFANDATAEFPVLSGSENSMVAAYASFIEEKYATDTVKVNVAEGGSLTIGLAGPATSIWNIFGMLSLHYYGVDLSASKAQYAQLYAEAAQIVKENAPMQASVKNTLVSTVTTYTVDDAMKSLEAEAEIDAAISALTTAISDAKASIEAYGKTKATLDSYLAKSATLDAAGQAAFDIAAIKEAFDNGTMASDQSAEIVAAYIAAVKAQNTPGADMTDAIVNPTVLTSADGWTIQSNGNKPFVAGQFFEFWKADPTTAEFDYYQVVNGLPAGKYTVSAEMINENANGDDQTGVYGSTATDTVSAGVKAATANAYTKYTTDPILVNDGTLRIGVKNFGAMSASWFVARNFGLTYIEATSTPKPETASYTIVFKNTEEADASTAFDAATDLSKVIESGAEFVSGIASTAYTYNGKAGFGAKFGSGKAAGELTLNLSAKGKVKATSYVVKAAKYSDEATYSTINGTSYSIASAELADYTVTLDEATDIATLSLSATEKGRYYIKSVTVNYVIPEVSGEAFDATLAHSPRYTTGKLYENVLGPNMIANQTKTVEGAAQTKPGIADRYQWIEYINPTSTLDNEKGEVQTSNRWTNYDPAYDDYNYAEGGNWIQVKNAAGSANSPVLSSAWGKHLVAYVKDTKRVEILGIGSAGGAATDGNNIVVTAIAQDNSETLEFASTPGGIYGKGTASDTCVVTLNPEKAYMLVIKGNETVQKDIMVGNIRLYGTSELAGPAVKGVDATYAYWDVIVGPDMVTNTKTKTAEDGTVANKWGISDDLKWIEYINPTSTLDDGTAEVQVSNRWTDLDPRTGKKGGFIQVKGADGNVNGPVLSSAWGKHMKFYVSGTKKFTAYGAGSASGSAADGNRLVITAQPFNSNTAIEAATEAGTIYGKGTASDFVSIDLDETETYEITVMGDTIVKKDIQLLGINLIDAAGEANQIANKGTLNLAIEKAIAAKETSLDLIGETWTLNGTAELSAEMTIQNGEIVADSTGNLSAQSKLILDNVKFDASATKADGKRDIAPIQLSAEADSAFYNQTLIAAVLYTDSAEVKALNDAKIAEIEKWNTEHAQEITDGEETAKVFTDTIKVGDVKEAAQWVAKNANATWKGFEAQEVTIKNSEIATAAPLIRTAAAWSLRNFNVEKSIVNVKYMSGKAVIDFEENGAGLIQNINIKESTLYADSAKTDMRFLRYAAQNDPWRVWGYEGDDKNAVINTWNMESNTIVNLCGNKEFANNVKNAATTELTWKKNAFANSWRLQKVGTNCKRNFEASDNTICGGVNEVDGTDASKWATLDKGMGITADNFTPKTMSLTDLLGYGDPRWASAPVDMDNVKTLNDLIEIAIAKKTTTVDLFDKSWDLIGTAELSAEMTIQNGEIVADSTGNLSAQSKLILDNVKFDASATKVDGKRDIAPIQLSAKADSAFYNQTLVAAVLYTDSAEVKALNDAKIAEIEKWNTEHEQEITDGEETAKVFTDTIKVGDIKEAAQWVAKNANASWKGFEAQEVSILNSEIATAAPLIRTAAAWSLHNFNVENTIVNVKYMSGKAVIDFEENGAGLIQNIDIKESTLYADSAKTDMRFLRYAAQNDPWRVWGYEGDDKNAVINTWNMESNTIVNLCGNKEFANNVKNAATTELTWKKNVFVNSWRLQKVGTNCKRNFEASDNAICGGVNEVDGTDASKWATVDTLMNIDYTFANNVIDFHPGKSSYAAKIGAGDPRWAVEYEEPSGIESIAAARKSDDIMFNLAGQRVNKANGLVIMNGKKMIIRK